MNPSHAVALACCAALAGCVGVPVDELLASTGIVAELSLENGARVEAARFSADGSASGFYRRIHIDPTRHPVIEWRWRVLQTPASLDPRVPARDDSPARVIVAFHGDATRLDIGERFTLRLYKALTGEKMPYAIIMYSWASDAPVGTITPSIPTGKIQTIVVESGGGIGEWRELRRNVLEDYRLAFGEEPWDIVAVGVMTDARNTNEKASAQFGDISFRPER